MALFFFPLTISWQFSLFFPYKLESYSVSDGLSPLNTSFLSIIVAATEGHCLCFLKGYPLKLAITSYNFLIFPLHLPPWPPPAMLMPGPVYSHICTQKFFYTQGTLPPEDECFLMSWDLPLLGPLDPSPFLPICTL